MTSKTFIPIALCSLVFVGASSLSHAAVYSQGFNVANGTTGAGLGDGSSINGTSEVQGYVSSVQNNVLELTKGGVTGTNGSFIIPALIGSSLGFTVEFNLFLQAAGSPADGFSFNYGNAFDLASIFGEEGPNVEAEKKNITWLIDTWDNNGADRGIRSKINGANDYVDIFVPLANDATLEHRVRLSWNPTDGMSMYLSGTTVFENRPTPDFAGGEDYLFGFGARTGGATETVNIDNIVITSIPEPTMPLLAGMGGLMAWLRRRRA